MMLSPKLSVIATTYNQAAFIAETLYSLLSDRANIKEIISSLTRDRCLLHVRTTNQGVSAAVNNVRYSVKSPYVALIAGDDISVQDGFQKRLELTRSSQADIVSAVPNLIDENGVSIRHAALEAVFRRPDSLDRLSLLRRFLYSGNFISAPSTIMKCDTFRRTLPVSNILLQLQDFDFWLRAWIGGAKIVVEEEPLLNYRIHN